MEIMVQVLTNEQLERWDKLLLQRTLDSLEDIMYCPKCSYPITIDENDTHAYCMKCKLDYCKLCKQTWHSVNTFTIILSEIHFVFRDFCLKKGACLSAEEKINQKVKSLNLSYDALVNMTDDEIKRQFKDPSFVQNLRKEAEKIDDDRKNSELIESKYKICPKCRIRIEKISGCNKITCICGSIFCYICGKIISGYDHFGEKSCALFTHVSTLVVPERPRHNVINFFNFNINLLSLISISYVGPNYR
jgi:E3 ubiquitin-protein ligase RNF14